MHFVDQKVPEDVTNISTIKDALEEHEVEEEEEMLKSKVAEQLFTSHPRFPCLSEMVSWICLHILRLGCKLLYRRELITLIGQTELCISYFYFPLGVFRIDIPCKNMSTCPK